MSQGETRQGGRERSFGPLRAHDRPAGKSAILAQSGTLEERCGGEAERARQPIARWSRVLRRCELAEYYRPAAARPACAPPTAEMLSWPALYCAAV